MRKRTERRGKGKRRKRNERGIKSSEQQQHQQQCPKYSKTKRSSSRLIWIFEPTSVFLRTLTISVTTSTLNPVIPTMCTRQALKHNLTRQSRHGTWHAKAELYLTGHQRVFWLCQALRDWKPSAFGTTEFKVRTTCQILAKVWQSQNHRP
jgi:hypothetical protein